MPDDPPAYDPDAATIPLAAPFPTASSSRNDIDLPLPEELTNLLPHGNYSVEGFLGQGGMGAVYKGTQVRLQRKVAIKIMRRDQGKDYGFEERFRREALAMAQLNHPNIVNVIDYGEAGPDFLYIVMELVDGADLMEVIRSGQMTQETALQLLPQICDALQFAHDHGIVHRDIKPSNIMLTRDGRVKMADFGLAKRFDVQSSFRTQTGTGMGTPDYAAPEQFDPTSTVDHRADIYALGVMIYQMVTGTLPRGAWKPPSEKADVDAHWDTIVSHALQTDPHERYASASEVKEDVSSIVLPVKAGSVGAPARNTSTGVANTSVRTQSMTSRSGHTQAGGRSSRVVPPAPTQSKTPLVLGILGAAAVLAAGAFFMMKKSDEGRATAPSSTAATKPAAQGNTSAPSNQTHVFGGHRYQLVAGPIRWEDAKAKAAAMGGHLATINSKEEDDWIQTSFAPALAPATGFWLGGANHSGPPWQWRWVTDEPFTYSGWRQGEGRDSQPRALCYTRENDNALGWADIDLDGSGARKYGTAFLVEWDDAGPANSASIKATQDEPFVNTLGMKFVPVPITGGPTDRQRVLFSVWETRQLDYDVFIKETQRKWIKPSFDPLVPTHPIVDVNWDDAQAFCAWLTERDQKAGKITANQRYRLPSDHEWSCAMGIGEREDAGKLPAEKNNTLQDTFPWGSAWPPPGGSGNYADASLKSLWAKEKHNYIKEVITGYDDGFGETSPVGSFAANRFGLFDMSGNAWQWCEDWMDASHQRRVVRAASWVDSSKTALLSSGRGAFPPNSIRHFIGFRCVLVSSASAASSSPLSQ